MRIRSFAIACLVFLATATSSQAGWDWNDTLGSYPDAMNINLLLGTKLMNSNDWAPADEPTFVGIDMDYSSDNFPVGMTFALLYANEEATEAGIKAEGTTIETHLGLRKVWYTRRQPWFTPYLGGGITLAYANAEASGAVDSSDSGFGMGGWIGGGAFVTLYEQINLGIDLRYSGTPANMDGQTVDAGGFYAGILLGVHLSDRN